MVKKWLVALGLGLMAVSAVAQDAAPALKDQKEKLSYAIGADIGNSLRRGGFEIDAATLAKGVSDAMAGGKLLLTEEEVKATLQAAQQEARQRVTVKMKADGESYLAANKSKEGVVTLPSGLQYKILTAGTGKKPTLDDTVVCHYRGTLVDGTEFDSSYKRNQPATFPVKGVIKGWTEALQLMPNGSKWQLVIPSSLGYGDNGNGPIPGNATLIFEVELVSIKEAAPAPAPALENLKK